jgi:multidrug efflux system membrane fusion protein
MKSAFVLPQWFAALALCVACTLSGCSEKSAEKAARAAPVVRVQDPIVKKVIDHAFFTGRTDAVDAVQLRARVTGYLVPWNFDAKSATPPTKDYNFTPGQEVKQNQILFKIDPRPYQATYDQAKAQVTLAEAELKLAKADYARALNVARTPGAISQQDVDKYAASQDKSAAEVEAQKANLESAALNLAFTDVLAPVDGIVSRNLLSIGNLVNADNTLLTTIVSQNPMYVYFDVDENTLELIKQMLREGKMQSVQDGAKVNVDVGFDSSADDYPYPALVDFVNNQIDPTTGTLQVRGVLDNPQPKQGPRTFTPGMFVRVRIPLGQPHEAILVQQKAIGTDQGLRYLFVVNDKNMVEKRPVKTGQEQPNAMQEVLPEKIVIEEDGNYRMPKEGEKGVDSITAKDRIVVGGLQRVRPGLLVDPKPENAEGDLQPPATKSSK